MLDFIGVGLAKLWKTGRKREIQNDKMSPAGFEAVTILSTPKANPEP